MIHKTKFLFLSLLFSFPCILLAQTPNESLNKHLQQMQQLFLEENYYCYSEFMHDRVHEINNSVERTQEISADGMQKMKEEEYEFLTAEFKNPSEIVEYYNQLQLTLTFEVLMNTPDGKLLEQYCMIGVSKDQGETWRFIDTAGRDKEMVYKFFGDLSPELHIFKTRSTPIE